MGENYFRDQTGSTPQPLDLWEPIVIPREEIDEEIDRLASLPQPANGRRRSVFVHPRNSKSLGLAPGIEVALDVLKPGERTVPYRQNSTQVNFVIRGQGTSNIDGRIRSTSLYDVWNTPSMAIYSHLNTASDLYVRLTYSNAALLDMMNVHYVEENPPPRAVAVEEKLSADDKKRRTSPFGTFPLNDEGAWLMPYEILINPPSVPSPALFWPWKDVKSHLDRLEALGKDYLGRRLYLLYNPMTGRTNGTTPNFFATMTIRPPKIVDRPHRHTSAAINYYFHGSGRSTVEGKVYRWKAGDLMLSAPGWAVHNHASDDDYVYELTVQDQALNIAMESLLWQESLKMPLAVLGKEEGLGTNREAAE
ncbi:MAG TPA: AraC family ligand binding domain-containing protein [Micropepsaceae bacterium]|nr:AraC family ligand binding domain-containing protein [Micropepsaceae bacterium]